MEQIETRARVWTTQAGITLTLALAMGLASLGTSIANIALPALVAAFDAPFAQVQGVVVAYLAALTISAVVAGRLGDRHGLKPMLVAGLGLFLSAAILAAIAPNLGLLIAARGVQGVGAAFLMVLSLALMRQSAEPSRLGQAMGLIGTVSALGTALGPSLGGVLIPLAGWRGIFWLQVPLAAVALGLAVALLPATRGTAGARAPHPGPGLDRRILPNLIINALVAAVMMTTLVVGPFYLALGLGLPETLVGLVMAVGPVLSIVSGVPSGRLVDRWGCSTVLAFGLGLLAAGAVLLALLPNLFGVAGYLLAMIVLTPGYQLFQSANNTATLAGVSQARSGTVSGLLGLSRNIGLIAGASAMGAVFAFGVGTEGLAHATPMAIGNGMRLTFLVAAAMTGVAILIAFRRGRVWRSAATPGSDSR